MLSIFASHEVWKDTTYNLCSAAGSLYGGPSFDEQQKVSTQDGSENRKGCKINT